MTDKNRAINTGPKSGMAQARKEFYGNAIPRIKRAIEHLFPLEAIALLESMMADRLESRLAYIFKQRADKRKFSTIGQLVEELCEKKSTESHEEKAVYGHVKTWGARRNEALHEMVKLAEGNEKDWGAKIQDAQEIAEAGLPLFGILDRQVKKLNKPPR